MTESAILTPRTISDAAASLRNGTITSVALTEEVLSVADVLDPIVGTYIARYQDTAMASAQMADEELAKGVDRGPLHGIPLGIKDIIACREGPTTGQSVVYDPTWWAGRDAPVVARLRNAGAVITGKTTTCEYAIGLPDASKPYPVPRDPWDLATWPGGSSSGSASGVASGMFLGALGTDTGGSVRMPSSLCGITGMKQTYGLVPKSGCYPLGVTLDHIGPMARSARDCADLLMVMAGYDSSDPSMIPRITSRDYPSMLTGDLAGVRIGVERANHLHDSANDPSLVERFEAAVAVLEMAGASIVEVTIPYYQELSTATMLTLQVEAFAYHQRHLMERWMDYGGPTRASLGGGALLTAVDYAQCQKARRIGKAALAELFAMVDLIVTPTCGIAAPPLEALSMETLLPCINTPYWNAVGNPALSVPMGNNGSGMPLGLQISGRPLEDGVVLRAGDAYQHLTDFHLDRPPAVIDMLRI
jgi:aspartyl-tRNA(Asn)/glutamyl-tRNA(Gln) amidotransferase subunit A